MGVIMGSEGVKIAGFEPEQIDVLARAYEATLTDLNLKDRHDPVAAMIARKIIDRAHRGELDAENLREQVSREVRGIVMYRTR
jgi:hypothetical protein